MRCPTGKLVYATPGEAHEVAAAARRASPHRRLKALKAYKCRFCGAWHLTSRRDPDLRAELLEAAAEQDERGAA